MMQANSDKSENQSFLSLVFRETEPWNLIVKSHPSLPSDSLLYLVRRGTLVEIAVDGRYIFRRWIPTRQGGEVSM